MSMLFQYRLMMKTMSCASRSDPRLVRDDIRASEVEHEEQGRKHVTYIIHAFNFARTNSEVVRNGTRLTVATVSASRRRGPDSPAARISICMVEVDKHVSTNAGFCE